MRQPIQISWTLPVHGQCPLDVSSYCLYCCSCSSVSESFPTMKEQKGCRILQKPSPHWGESNTLPPKSPPPHASQHLPLPQWMVPLQDSHLRHPFPPEYPLLFCFAELESLHGKPIPILTKVCWGRLPPPPHSSWWGGERPWSWSGLRSAFWSCLFYRPKIKSQHYWSLKCKRPWRISRTTFLFDSWEIQTHRVQMISQGQTWQTAAKWQCCG